VENKAKMYTDGMLRERGLRWLLPLWC